MGEFETESKADVLTPLSSSMASGAAPRGALLWRDVQTSVSGLCPARLPGRWLSAAGGPEARPGAGL